MGSTMGRINIASPQFGYDPGDPPGFRSGMLRFGPMLGASQMGASVYELPPGEAICPYHYEYGEEEWLLVLEGRPSVRHPEGTDRLEPWDVVCFPRGPEGAHAVRADDVIVKRSSAVGYWCGEEGSQGESPPTGS
jgi:uncharacterized cupin superfamily protein